jgi:transposase
VETQNLGQKNNSNLDNFQTFEELNKEHFFKAMKLCSHNKTKVAKVLGVTIKTVYNLMDKYNKESLKNLKNATTAESED